jgi:hypothetical protein
MRPVARDPAHEAEEARAEAARLRVHVRELEELQRSMAEELRVRAEQSEYNQLQAEMGKLLVRRTQLQALHLSHEKQELRRSLEAAQSQLLNVKVSYGGIANGYVALTGREFQSRALHSSQSAPGLAPLRDERSSLSASRGASRGAAPPIDANISAPERAAPTADADDANGVDELRREQSAAASSGEALRLSAQQEAVSPFSVFVALSRREEREMRSSLPKTADLRWRRHNDHPSIRAVGGQFRPVEPALRSAPNLTIEAMRSKLQVEVEALKQSWGSELDERPSTLADRPSTVADRPSTVADRPATVAEMQSSSARARPFSRQQERQHKAFSFRALAAEELIPFEATPGGGTIPMPTWPALQRLIEPYVDGLPPRTAGESALARGRSWSAVELPDSLERASSRQSPSARPSTHSEQRREALAHTLPVPAPLARPSWWASEQPRPSSSAVARAEGERASRAGRPPSQQPAADVFPFGDGDAHGRAMRGRKQRMGRSSPQLGLAGPRSPSERRLRHSDSGGAFFEFAPMPRESLSTVQ